MGDEPDIPSIRELMTGNVVVVRPDDPLALAVDRMVSEGVRHLPVVDGEDRLGGMLSDRDIRPVFRSARPGSDSSRQRDDEGRSSRCPTPRTPCSSIVDEEQHPIGMISYADLLRALTS
jgi:CBS domain-containing protein